MSSTICEIHARSNICANHNGQLFCERAEPSVHVVRCNHAQQDLPPPPPAPPTQTQQMKAACLHEDMHHLTTMAACTQELNARATHLLFRDKRRHLHLYNIAKQERTTLLPYCSYVQWVPGSDVVVAQSRSSLCVWYSINAPDQQTVLAIKGDVENIERTRVG